jgi:L-alanine-DL-glutamate epimerase-like enolase superfamily enzyme
MPVIHVSNTDKMRHWAELWLNDGYRHLKIKARGDLDADVAAIAAIRKVAGRDVMLQVDANGGYGDIESGERAVRAMQAYDVDCYEDMAVSSLSELAQMRKRTGACIMVDGLSYWPGVQKVIEAKAADVINHHPNNQGGLGAALLINSAAIGAGIETAVGSSGLFGVQDAAFQMLSSVIGLGRPCEDIGLVPYYSGPTKGEYDFEYEPSVIKESYVLKNGTIEIPDAGGLGIELDERKLKGLRKEVYRFSL